MKRADVVDATVRVLKQAETTLPDWVMKLIEQAFEQETNPVARSHLQFMLENIRIAGAEGLPLCQDTGTATIVAPRSPPRSRARSSELANSSGGPNSWPIRIAINPEVGGIRAIRAPRTAIRRR